MPRGCAPGGGDCPYELLTSVRSMMGIKGLFAPCGCALFWITSMSIDISHFGSPEKRALAGAPRLKIQAVAYGIDPA